MMLHNIIQTQMMNVNMCRPAVLALQSHALLRLASFEMITARTQLLFTTRNHISNRGRRTKSEISLLVHCRTYLPKSRIFLEFSRIRSTLIDNPRNVVLNWYVPEESQFLFRFEEVALYVMIWLQIRPLNLHRHQIVSQGLLCDWYMNVKLDGDPIFVVRDA